MINALKCCNHKNHYNSVHFLFFPTSAITQNTIHSLTDTTLAWALSVWAKTIQLHSVQQNIFHLKISLTIKLFLQIQLLTTLVCFFFFLFFVFSLFLFTAWVIFKERKIKKFFCFYYLDNFGWLEYVGQIHFTKYVDSCSEFK